MRARALPNVLALPVNVVVLATALLLACSDPPEQGPCADEDAGEGTGGETSEDACEPPVVPDGVVEACADPEFGEAPPIAPAPFACTGVAGGAIVYNSVVFADKGGPGSVQLDPPQIVFPGDDDSVRACCVSPPADGSDIENACESDCARAACNRVLTELRKGIDSKDPSDGKCSGIQACIDRVRDSLKAWEASLIAQYDKCLDVARVNDDPWLPYADFLSPFIGARKVVLEDSGCDPGHLGCLYNAEVRLYCAVETFEVVDDGECDSAGNLRHPSAKPQLLAIGPGLSTLTVRLPTGAVITAVVHSTGGSMQRICQNADACSYRLLDFGFDMSKPVELGMFELVSATASFVGTPIGTTTTSGGVAFAQDTTELWVSGLVELGVGTSKIEVPVEFALSAGDAMLTRHTGVAFSIEGFHATFSGYEVELATAPAAAAPL